MLNQSHATTDRDECTRNQFRDARASSPAERIRLQNLIVLDYLWLADRAAHRFDHRGAEPNDLVQVARAALVEVVRRYDPERGSFLAFARPWIDGVLKRHFRDHLWLVRPPRATQELTLRVHQIWPLLVQERGRFPTDVEVAELLDEPVAQVREARAAGQGYRAAPLEASGIECEFAHADDATLRRDDEMTALQAWSILAPEERRLLRRRFWEGQSQAEIATATGVSQMQVSRLLAKTLERMRDALGVAV